MPRELKPCGTYAAYQRHLYNSEVPCRPCMDAKKSYQLARRSSRAYWRARSRAISRLVQAYRDEYDALLAEERTKEEAR